MVQLANRGERSRRVAEPAPAEPGDLVVALGGDGTVLSALRTAASVGAPVLGVACGSLGALSAVTAGEIAAAVGRVWAGDWTPRPVPALVIDTGERALNDFVVVRRGAGQLGVAVAVDDEPYVRFTGDGLIVATTLGSSAYSMAAGGPLLASGTAAFVCTPLAMHGGNAPSLVLPGAATLTVEVDPGYAGFDVEVDGRRRPSTPRSYRLTLRPDELSLVSFGRPDRGLEGLRRRGLIADSPRILARDRRA
jgi:NAD+ kinase